MKRRSFLATLTGAIAAAAVSARLIREEPKPEVTNWIPLHNLVGNRYNWENGEWKVVHPFIRQGDFSVPNPEFQTAQYQDFIMVSEDLKKHMIERRPHTPYA